MLLMIPEWSDLLFLGVIYIAWRGGCREIAFKASRIFYPILLLSLF